MTTRTMKNLKILRSGVRAFALPRIERKRDAVVRTILFDQSSSGIGYAVIENKILLHGFEYAPHGLIAPSRQTMKAPARLIEMEMDIVELMDCFKPDEMVIEAIYYGDFRKNEENKKGQTKILSPKTVEPLSWAAWICVRAATMHQIPVYRLRPQRWKSACGAKGRRETIKQDVQRIVCQYWNIPANQIKSTDHSDALGMAACWNILGEDSDFRKECSK